MQEQYPELPTIEAEQLATLRTLEQIMGAFNSAPQTPAPAATTQPTPPAQAAVPVKSETKADIYDKAELQDAFLNIVSEKTGYPTDMLELSMDMEADLGIDSIKRVEILGAMQEQYPELPTIEAEDLANLRTLEQIIATFSQTPKNPSTSSGTSPKVKEQPHEDGLETSTIQRMPVGVKELSRPDFLEFDLPADALVLISDDGTETTRLLAESFSKQELPVGVLHYKGMESPNSKGLPKGVQHFEVTPGDEKGIEKSMKAISARYSKLAAFIHLQPAPDNHSKDVLAVPENEAEILKSVFLMARHLNKALTAAGEKSRPAFLTVSHIDGTFGLNGNGSNDPLSGGLGGLVKTLRLEWTGVFCRALDIAPQVSPQETVEIIQAELHDPDLRLSEVGYTPEGRYTLAI
jgi:acyl carrier protein